YQKALGLCSTQVVEYLAVIGPLRSLKIYPMVIGLICQFQMYQKALGLSTQVVVYLAVIGSLCRVQTYLEKIGLRALGYLKETIDLELYYRPKRRDHYVEGFSDASFAPHGSRSVGCCLTRYLEQPVAWRCGRQALVALSVAEAELVEAISAAQMSYGVIAVTSELHTTGPTLVLKVDNAAAVGLCNESVLINWEIWGRKRSIVLVFNNYYSFGA
ncbi:GIP, partial [Symbiodinium necroappetens]